MVWLAEYQPAYEPGRLLGVFATKELAEQAKAREVAKPDYPPAASDVYVWAEDVVTELPPVDPPKRPYQVIP
jgi:hypothetical protein